MTKQITLTPEQAREMLGKDAAMDQLIRANFTDEELNPKPKYPKRWEDVDVLGGYYVDATSEVEQLKHRLYGTSDASTFTTEQQARSFGVVAAQLSQLMKVYRGEWVPDWGDDTKKCVIYCDGKEGLNATNTIAIYYFLSFPTREIADQFLTDHRELIEEFYRGM